MILRNHGLLTVGRTVAEAFNALHRLELSCKTQIAAMSCGTKLREVPQAVVAPVMLKVVVAWMVAVPRAMILSAAPPATSML